MAVPVITVDTVERGQVELVDHVRHEPVEVAGGQPVARVGWEQERLVRVAVKEIVGHAPFYSFATLVENRSV